MFPMVRMLRRDRSYGISKLRVKVMRGGFIDVIGALRLLCLGGSQGPRSKMLLGVVVVTLTSLPVSVVM
jgi:hypothetical protein